MTANVLFGRLPRIVITILGISIWAAAIGTTTIRTTTIPSVVSSFFNNESVCLYGFGNLL